jgi:hypothetical protein
MIEEARQRPTQHRSYADMLSSYMVPFYDSIEDMVQDFPPVPIDNLLAAE